ncbi:MAG: small basic family protein [Fimbriimonadaceae bacterium]|nr:small basic family protein [Fimbriimonadaceae bacterium]
MSPWPLIALVVGVALGLFLGVPIPREWGPYLGVMILAGIDTVFGGFRGQMEGKFNPSIFFSGLLGNLALACGVTALGDRVGLNLALVVSVVFVMRIFTNLSLARRQLLTDWASRRDRARLEQEVARRAEESHE